MTGLPRIVPALCLLALPLAAAPAGAQESAYTELDVDNCPVLEKHEESGGISWLCAGYGGMPLYVAEGDLRYFISYGVNHKDKLAATQTLPPFNGIGKVMEWRLEQTARGLKPYATILRYHTDSDADGTLRKGEVLVVSKVAVEEACHVAYVDARANKDANALARQAADTLARGFACGKDEARVVGASGVSPM